jgi:hypothetical protein
MRRFFSQLLRFCGAVVMNWVQYGLFLTSLPQLLEFLPPYTAKIATDWVDAYIGARAILWSAIVGIVVAVFLAWKEKDDEAVAVQDRAPAHFDLAVESVKVMADVGPQPSSSVVKLNIRITNRGGRSLARAWEVNGLLPTASTYFRGVVSRVSFDGDDLITKPLARDETKRGFLLAQLPVIPADVRQMINWSVSCQDGHSQVYSSRDTP